MLGIYMSLPNAKTVKSAGKQVLPDAKTIKSAGKQVLPDAKTIKNAGKQVQILPNSALVVSNMTCYAYVFAYQSIVAHSWHYGLQ